LVPLDTLLDLIRGSSVTEGDIPSSRGEADQILAKCGSGELDIYDVMSNPKNPAEATAAKIIQQMYDDVAIDHRLHPDDDFEKILDIVADQLAEEYGESNTGRLPGGQPTVESAEDVLTRVATGELDAYDVMSNPKTAEEKVASSKLQSMYDDVSIDYHLHPDDEFEKILDIVVDQLATDLGVDEGMGDNINPVAGGSKHSMTDKTKATKPQFKYEESVESTAGHAVSAALAELRKLAGI
jgi:hypothetical protein